jgi:hypothetical protein
MWLFQSCVPMRTFTVFCMRPAETTTALMVLCVVRVAMIELGFWKSEVQMRVPNGE